MPLSTGESRDYTIAMVNDEDTPRNGRLRLLFTDAAGQGSRGPGAQSYTVPPIAPAVSGNYSLQVAAAAEDDSAHPTLSHRDVFVREDPTDK